MYIFTVRVSKEDSLTERDFILEDISRTIGHVEGQTWSRE